MVNMDVEDASQERLAGTLKWIHSLISGWSSTS